MLFRFFELSVYHSLAHEKKIIFAQTQSRSSTNCVAKHTASALAQHAGSFLSNTNEPGRILVLIKLDGGNDGLNTIIPLNQLSELNAARPHVMLPEDSIINLGRSSLGLHPELTGFKSLFDEQRLKIIQNVGYEQPDFSHFRSMDIWQSASDYDEFLNSGWMVATSKKNIPIGRRLTQMKTILTPYQSSWVVADHPFCLLEISLSPVT